MPIQPGRTSMRPPTAPPRRPLPPVRADATPAEPERDHEVPDEPAPDCGQGQPAGPADDVTGPAQD